MLLVFQNTRFISNQCNTNHEHLKGTNKSVNRVPRKEQFWINYASEFIELLFENLPQKKINKT